MARFNISPETVNCKCCPDNRVPEIGYSVCKKRRGLVPETVEPLIHKRVEYKKRIREMEEGPQREVYRRRQSAHKWLLVTCFGYLGYKNARFGRIEAHEAVTAYGRECLLHAKEIAENARVIGCLHANVDSRRGCKSGVQQKITPEANRQEDYDALLDEITRKTQIPIALEGIYRWVAFLPSRQDERMSVANRYFGIFDNGEIKMRGIETRRRDTPPFIVAAQMEMLKVLATAKSRQELSSLGRASDSSRVRVCRCIAVRTSAVSGFGYHQTALTRSDGILERQSARDCGERNAWQLESNSVQGNRFNTSSRKNTPDAKM